MTNNDNSFDNTLAVMLTLSPHTSPVLYSFQPWSVVRTAIITHVLKAALRCAPAWMSLAPVEAVRRDVSVTLASNSVEGSVSQQRTVVAGRMDNTMK